MDKILSWLYFAVWSTAICCFLGGCGYMMWSETKTRMDWYDTQSEYQRLKNLELKAILKDKGVEP